MSWAEDRIALAMDAKRMGIEEARARIVKALMWDTKADRCKSPTVTALTGGSE